MRDNNILISFEEMKQFLMFHYRHSRLYGRNKDNGWDDGYGDRIVEAYHIDIINGKRCYISRHEHQKADGLSFSSQDVFNYIGYISSNDTLEAELEVLKEMLGTDSQTEPKLGKSSHVTTKDLAKQKYAIYTRILSLRPRAKVS